MNQLLVRWLKPRPRGRSLFKKILFSLLGLVAVGLVAFFAAPKAISQSVFLAQVPAGEYDNPELLEQGTTVVPNYGYSPYAGGREFHQRVFWGDTHLHTVYSFDAGTAGTRLTPEDAYRFAPPSKIFKPPGTMRLIPLRNSTIPASLLPLLAMSGPRYRGATTCTAT